MEAVGRRGRCGGWEGGGVAEGAGAHAAAVLLRPCCAEVASSLAQPGWQCRHPLASGREQVGAFGREARDVAADGGEDGGRRNFWSGGGVGGCGFWLLAVGMGQAVVAVLVVYYRTLDGGGDGGDYGDVGGGEHGRGGEVGLRCTDEVEIKPQSVVHWCGGWQRGPGRWWWAGKWDVVAVRWRGRRRWRHRKGGVEGGKYRRWRRARRYLLGYGR